MKCISVFMKSITEQETVESSVLGVRHALPARSCIDTGPSIWENDSSVIRVTGRKKSKVER